MPDNKTNAWDGTTKLSFSPSDLTNRSTPLRGAINVTSTVVAPVATRKARVITNRTAQDDYNEIKRALNRMVWKGNYGPTVYVKTKLNWDAEPHCQELYLKLKYELHDQPIPGYRLFYFVGRIGNWGKSGFRITGHTKKSDQIKSSVTHGVLHIDNG